MQPDAGLRKRIEHFLLDGGKIPADDRIQWNAVDHPERYPLSRAMAFDCAHFRPLLYTTPDNDHDGPVRITILSAELQTLLIDGWLAHVYCGRCEQCRLTLLVGPIVRQPVLKFDRSNPDYSKHFDRGVSIGQEKVALTIPLPAAGPTAAINCRCSVEPVTDHEADEPIHVRG